MSGFSFVRRELGRWRAGLIEGGTGDPVVLLHGSADGAFTWKGVLTDLGAGHRASALDFPSTELQAAGSGAGRLDEDGDLLASLLDAFDVPVHVVGHSYGALLALRHVLTDASRVRSLCLIEPIAFGLLGEPPRPGEPDEHGVVPVFRAFVAAWESGEVADAVGVIVDYWNGAGTWSRLPEELRARILAGRQRFHDEVQCARADRTAAEELVALDLPVLVVSGEESPRAARTVCDRLADALPRARGLRIAGAGHSPMRTHPQLLARELVAFFEQARGLSGRSSGAAPR